MDNTLSERQQAILALIVREHVTLKTPVGSDAIVRKYCPGVSPATVRNDMVTLANHGYVFSTHPSSGRVPTDAGYRYYVRHLMRPVDMPADERRMINHQFHQIERDLDQWSQLAASVLTQLTGYASFVTPPLVRRSRLRHADLVATQDRAAMLLALLREGTLHRQLVTLDAPLNQAQLDEVAHRLTRELHGKRAEEIRDWSGARSPLERSVRDSLAALLKRVDQQSVSDVRYDGVSSLLAQPEFSRGGKAGDLLRAFEQRQTLNELADLVRDHEGVQVFIGDENPSPILRECATVATRYGNDGTAGVIGVIGPTRMRYDRVIVALEYVRDLLTELWADLCG